jgi:1,4-dihydroxy-2-naphthoate octaprenyltransferase/chlorophyll synthase
MAGRYASAPAQTSGTLCFGYTLAVSLPSLSQRERWLLALKPASWPKLLVPAGLGQAIGVAVTGSVDPGGLVTGIGFTVLVLAAVVLLNDYGDQEVDALKRRLFPEACAPKTIPDEILEARSVLWAGLGAVVAALGVALAGQLFLPRPGLVVAAVVCLLLFWAYTFAPLRLNYRGGGEVLEMLGVGFALPWWNAYVQSGVPQPGGLVVLPAFALLCLASALASGLADEPSDRLGGKRTFTTMFGTFAVRQATEGLVLGAMIVWAILPLLAPAWASAWMVLPALVVMAFEYRELRKAGASSDADTYEGTRGYKRCLHHAIWRGTAVLSVAIVVIGFLMGGIG